MSNAKESLCTNDTCTQCKANKCNAQIFPEDRLSCLHCEGGGCVNQTNTIDVRYPCVNYAVDDECFVIFSYGMLLNNLIDLLEKPHQTSSFINFSFQF